MSRSTYRHPASDPEPGGILCHLKVQRAYKHGSFETSLLSEWGKRLPCGHILPAAIGLIHNCALSPLWCAFRTHTPLRALRRNGAALQCVCGTRQGRRCTETVWKNLQLASARGMIGRWRIPSTLQPHGQRHHAAPRRTGRQSLRQILRCDSANGIDRQVDCAAHLFEKLQSTPRQALLAIRVKDLEMVQSGVRSC